MTVNDDINYISTNTTLSENYLNDEESFEKFAKKVRKKGDVNKLPIFKETLKYNIEILKNIDINTDTKPTLKLMRVPINKRLSKSLPNKSVPNK